MTQESTWFGARLLFESVHPGETAVDPLFEERIIVVRALQEDDARRKAVSAGKRSTHEYQNEYGETVIWTFREVLDVVPIYDDDLADGSEVYSALMGPEDVERLRKRFGKVPTAQPS